MLWSLSQGILNLLFATSSTAKPIIRGPSGLSYIGLHNATSGQDYFLGIPFAEPPVGPLRFKPPVPWSAGNSTIIYATRDGHSCEQSISYTTNSFSEDCLTLNIWKPTSVFEKLPVMVWIYGGGFYSGEIQRFPGTYLLEKATKIYKPIIYVTMNYRLGLFGFPPGQAAADAGGINLGLKDQRLALEWVQQNIQYFGGDPDRVTLFGESAGAMSTVYQSFYRGGNISGVFRGMILESASPTTLSARAPNDPVREAGFQFVVNATGCSSAPNQFECVRNAPADVLSQANKDIFAVEPQYAGHARVPGIFGPTFSPKDDFFTEPIDQLMHRGEFAKVPFINGAQLDEGTVFVDGPSTSIQTDDDIIDWLTARFPGLYFGISNATAVKEILRYYPTALAAGSPYDTGNQTFGRGAQYKRFASLFGDIGFQARTRAPRRDHLRTAAKFGVDAWSYIFKEPPPDFHSLHGIPHGGKLAIVMQMLHILRPNASMAEIDLQETVGDYWINFSYNLDPNPRTNPKRPSWPRYREAGMALQILASNVTAVMDSKRSEAIDFIIGHHGLYAPLPNVPKSSIPLSQQRLATCPCVTPMTHAICLDF